MNVYPPKSRPTRHVLLPTALAATILLWAGAARTAHAETVGEEIKRLRAQLDSENSRHSAVQNTLKTEIDHLADSLGLNDHPSTTATPKTAQSKGAAGSLKTEADNAAATPEGKVKAEAAQRDDFFYVPDSPSAAILGVSPQDVVRPANAKKLIGAILNGVDKHGNFQTGVAIDVIPYKFFVPESKEGQPGSLSDDPNLHFTPFSGKYYQRVLQRTQLSFLTAKGTDDADKSLRLAIGVQVTLMDETDPYLKIVDLWEAQRKYEPAVMRRRLGRSHDEVTDVRRKSFHYNSAWAVGAAQAFISQDGGSGDFRSAGYAVYSTYTYGFEGADVLYSKASYLQKHDQLLFQVEYRDHDRVPDAKNKGAFLSEDRIKLGLRFRFGDEDLNASFIGSFMEEKVAGGNYRPAYSVAFSVEKLLFGNTYLTASVGKEFDHADGNDPVLAIGGVKFGFSPPASGRDPKQ